MKENRCIIINAFEVRGMNTLALDVISVDMDATGLSNKRIIDNMKHKISIGRYDRCNCITFVNNVDVLDETKPGISLKDRNSVFSNIIETHDVNNYLTNRVHTLLYNPIADQVIGLNDADVNKKIIHISMILTIIADLLFMSNKDIDSILLGEDIFDGRVLGKETNTVFGNPLAKRRVKAFLDNYPK